MTVGLVVTVAAFAIAGRRVWWLKRLAFSGQSAPDRVAAVRSHPGTDLKVEATEVLGQHKLLKWTVPGMKRSVSERLRARKRSVACDLDMAERFQVRGFRGVSSDQCGRRSGGRPDDLVFNYWVNNYLMGEQPPPSTSWLLSGRSADGDQDVRGAGGVQPAEHGIKLSIG